MVAQAGKRVGVLALILFLLGSAHARAARLYWAQTFEDRIRRAALTGNDAETVLETPVVFDAVAVATDPLSGNLYWAQSFGDRIIRSDLAGSGVVTVVEAPQVFEPVAVAVDTAASKLYWAQSFGDRIMRADLDGSNVEVLLEAPLVFDPVALAVDEAAGKIYWAQSFGDRILRADLDGTNIEVVAEAPTVFDPVAIALDPAAGKLYWAQSFGDRISRVDITGANAETLLEAPEIFEPVALAVDSAGQKLYWAQSFGDRIMRADLDGTNSEVILASPEVFGPVALALSPAPVEPVPVGVPANRYISFYPSDDGVDVAFEVTIGDSAFFPDAVGLTGWVSQPDANNVARFVDESAAFHSTAWPDVVHVGDCEIGPVATYVVRATDGTYWSAPVKIDTIDHPGGGTKWADCTGPFDYYCTGSFTCCAPNAACPAATCAATETCMRQWPPPNGTTNFIDVQAAIRTFQSIGVLPPVTWVDLHGAEGATGNAAFDPPNYIVNFSDVQQIIQGFQGDSYPYSNPLDCP